MSWQADWKKWTHATYGLIQAVHIARRVDLGNHSKLLAAIDGARNWNKSDLHIVSRAVSKPLKAGSIRIQVDQVDDIAASIGARALEILLIGTVSITEVILGDLLVQCGAIGVRPGKFSQALDVLEKHLKARGNFAKHAWAIGAAHEMRIIRNCLAHAAATWTSEATREFRRRFGSAPQVGSQIAIGIDDVFRYRRAARAVLNAAARL